MSFDLYHIESLKSMDFRLFFNYIGIYAEIRSRDGMYMKLCSRRGYRHSLFFYLYTRKIPLHITAKVFSYF